MPGTLTDRLLPVATTVLASLHPRPLLFQPSELSPSLATLLPAHVACFLCSAPTFLTEHWSSGQHGSQQRFSGSVLFLS